jgi:hypothetical protein
VTLTLVDFFFIGEVLSDRRLPGFEHISSLYSIRYSEKFGVHAVNFTDPARPRKMKASAKFLKSLIADNGFAENPSCPYF